MPCRRDRLHLLQSDLLADLLAAPLADLLAVPLAELLAIFCAVGATVAQKRYYFERRRSIIRDFLGKVAADKTITAWFAKPSCASLTPFSPILFGRPVQLPEDRAPRHEAHALRGRRALGDLRTSLAKFKATRPEQDQLIGALRHGLQWLVWL